jgi:hypothetical protein
MENQRVYDLIAVAETSTGMDLKEILLEIWDLCADMDYKIAFANPELGFLSLLKNIIINEPEYIVDAALGCIWYISRAHTIRPYVGSRKLGLVELLLPFIQNGHRYGEVAIKIISNFTINPETHSYLLSDNLNYMQDVKSLLVSETIERYPYQAFHCIGVSADRKYAAKLIQLNVPQLFINFLINNSADPYYWPNRGSGSQYFALNFLANFSSLLQEDTLSSSISSKDSFEYFYKSLPPNFEAYLVQLSSYDAMESMKAFMIYANFYHCHYSLHRQDKDDKNPIIFLFQANSRTFSLIFDMIAHQLNISTPMQLNKLNFYRHAYGILRLRSLLFTLRNLFHQLLINSQYPYDGMKYFLLKYGNIYFKNINEILKLFIFDEPEPSKLFDIAVEYAGGGGRDYDSIEYVLEMLIMFFQHFQYFEEFFNWGAILQTAAGGVSSSSPSASSSSASSNKKSSSQSISAKGMVELAKGLVSNLIQGQEKINLRLFRRRIFELSQVENSSERIIPLKIHLLKDILWNLIKIYPE